MGGVGGASGAGPTPQALGKIWSESSVALIIEDKSYNAMFPSGSTASCYRLERAAMTAEQLALLAGYELSESDGVCWIDDYRYRNLTVVDAIGSQTEYTDCGCQEDPSQCGGGVAGVMLPFEVVDFPLGAAEPCLGAAGASSR